MTQEGDEHGPGGMDAIPDEAVEDSDEPGGMSGIPDPDPDRERRHEED